MSDMPNAVPTDATTIIPSDAPIEIHPFAFADASDREYAALNRHMNRSRAETLPDDPPTPLEETIAQMKTVPPMLSISAWIGWDAAGVEIVASAVMSFMRTEENTHLVQFDMSVDPAYRRRGIGRELLRQVVEAAQREGRRLMITDTNERIPAGEAFMQRLGAQRGLEMHTNQLLLGELDTEQLGRWQAEAAERAPGFALGFWDGSYPEERLEDIARLNDVMNTAPRDGLDMEDSHMTPDELRQMEKMMLLPGRQRWSLYAMETATGRLAGFTEIHLNRNRPLMASQGFTGVYPEFRGLGLGLWMKAAMLDRLRRDQPEVRFVRTGNADSNQAMLAINRTLGFRPYISRCVWQVETEAVLAYLAGTK